MTKSDAPDCRKSHASRLAAEFRRKAEQCARLADGAVPPGVADTLRLMAEEYEERAVRLDGGAPPCGAAAVPAPA
jgi:hypothetical protein